MQVKIVADENISISIIHSLRDIGLNVMSIFDSHRGITDAEILQFCTTQPSILLTSDKNFAAWAAASRPPETGIVLLRFERGDIDNMIESLKIVFQNTDSLLGVYTVIAPTKIRQRII